MREFGLAKVEGGPFPTEAEAVADARSKRPGAFITGRKEEGWYWAKEAGYVALGGNRLNAVNFIGEDR